MMRHVAANALTLLSTDLLGATGRQIGLDALRIERGDVVTDEFREDPSALLQDEDPVTRLTLSKRLSEQVDQLYGAGGHDGESAGELGDGVVDDVGPDTGQQHSDGLQHRKPQRGFECHEV